MNYESKYTGTLRRDPRFPDEAFWQRAKTDYLRDIGLKIGEILQANREMTCRIQRLETSDAFAITLWVFTNEECTEGLIEDFERAMRQ